MFEFVWTDLSLGFVWCYIDIVASVEELGLRLFRFKFRLTQSTRGRETTFIITNESYVQDNRVTTLQSLGVLKDLKLAPVVLLLLTVVPACGYHIFQIFRKFLCKR